jgi:hypothetical protein
MSGIYPHLGGLTIVQKAARHNRTKASLTRRRAARVVAAPPLQTFRIYYKLLSWP